MKIDQNYLDLYNNRREGEREAWLDASKNVLRAHYYGAHKDIRYAASALSKSCTFDQARALAYSAYCFWHQPLLDYANRNGAVYNHSSKNSMPWMMNGIFRTALLMKDDARVARVLESTTEYLNLATIAFSAATSFATGYKKFQQKVFGETVTQLAGDKEIQGACKAWPHIVDKGCHYVDGAVQNGVLNPAVVTAIQDLNTKQWLERSSLTFMRAAKKIRPDIFGRHPDVEAVLFDPSHTSGTYKYGADVSSYYFNDDAAWSFKTPLNLLVGGLHESEHILQYHLVGNCYKLSQKDGLRRGALLFLDNVAAQKDCNADGAISLYAAGLSGFDPLWKAYESRPLEAFAWRLDALGYCLAEKWQQPFYAWDKPSFADLKVIGRKALGLVPR